MKCAELGCLKESPLFRQNPKGQPGIFKCAVHSKSVDDELVRVVAHLQSGKPVPDGSYVCLGPIKED